MTNEHSWSDWGRSTSPPPRKAPTWRVGTVGPGAASGNGWVSMRPYELRVNRAISAWLSGIDNPVPPFVGPMITGRELWPGPGVDGDVMLLMNVDRPEPMSAEMNAYLQSSGALFVAGLRHGVSVAVSMHPDWPGMQIEPFPCRLAG
jgi:hypothetical protein